MHQKFFSLNVTSKIVLLVACIISVLPPTSFPKSEHTAHCTILLNNPHFVLLWTLCAVHITKLTILHHFCSSLEKQLRCWKVFHKLLNWIRYKQTQRKGMINHQIVFEYWCLKEETDYWLKLFQFQHQRIFYIAFEIIIKYVFVDDLFKKSG